MKISEIKKILESRKDRSSWSKGVTIYAIELLEDLEGYKTTLNKETVKRELLNGAADWNQYSWSGLSLIYNADIARRLCNNSEFKRTKNGERKPNTSEEWLDVQVRALVQASNRIKEIITIMEA